MAQSSHDARLSRGMGPGKNSANQRAYSGGSGSAELLGLVIFGNRLSYSVPLANYFNKARGA
jgi:hypothetical protein